MPQLKVQKNKRKFRMILVSVFTVLFLMLSWMLLFGPLKQWLFSESIKTIDAGFPGAAGAADGSFQYPEQIAEQLQDRIQLLLFEQNQFAVWYRQSDRPGVLPAERAAVALASDQILYARYLLEQENKTAFQAWWAAFKSQWQNPDGSYQGARPLNPVVSVNPDTDWLRINFSMARVLAQSVSLWPDQARMNDLQRLSRCLLSTLNEETPVDHIAVVPTAAPILDPGATPTPKPLLSPVPTPEPRVTLPVIRLASIDLYAMELLTQLDPEWSEWGEYYEAVVMEGFLGETMPLFAWAWDPEQKAYVTFQGDQPHVDTEEALLTMLHLCEVGVIPEMSINWVRSQMMNQSALYKQYHPVQGTATDSLESIASYALAARIARMIDDSALYQITVDRMMWHQATSRTSDVLHALFRQETQDTASVWAHDNLWGLLALR